MPEVVTTLDLGAKAVIDGAQWQIIGVMRRTVVNGDGEWFEYLLYSASRGFLWLVETDEGWSRARVLEALAGDGRCGRRRARRQALRAQR